MNAAGGEAVHAPDNVAGWLVLVCAYSDEIVFQTAYRYGSAEGLISAPRVSVMSEGRRSTLCKHQKALCCYVSKSC